MPFAISEIAMAHLQSNRKPKQRQDEGVDIETNLLGVKVLVRDLKHLSTDDKLAMDRLDKVAFAEAMMSPIYTPSPHIRAKLKEWRNGQGDESRTFLQVFQDYVESKGKLCTAHHLAPLFMQHFNIEEANLESKQVKESHRQLEYRWKSITDDQRISWALQEEPEENMSRQDEGTTTGSSARGGQCDKHLVNAKLEANPKVSKKEQVQ